MHLPSSYINQISSTLFQHESTAGPRPIPSRSELFLLMTFPLFLNLELNFYRQSPLADVKNLAHKNRLRTSKIRPRAILST